jgi:hypothetical protein
LTDRLGSNVELTGTPLTVEEQMKGGQPRLWEGGGLGGFEAISQTGNVPLPPCFGFLAARSMCLTVFSCCFLQQTKERVKLLIQLADGFCEKGHAHAAEIKKCVTAVDKRYRDFSLRMEKYRTSLEKALGISSDSNKSVNCFVHTGLVVIWAPYRLSCSR